MPDPGGRQYVPVTNAGRCDVEFHEQVVKPEYSAQKYLYTGSCARCYVRKSQGGTHDGGSTGVAHCGSNSCNSKQT